jgi:hypothetical protein
VIDHQIYGYQRIDPLWIPAQRSHAVTHCGQVNDCWDAGEVLKNDACGFKRNLELSWLARVPLSEIVNVLFGNLISIAMPQDGFEKNANGEGESADVCDPRSF